ncbi:MAG TPA: DUF992 domain-containing protein [Stellaceae bacterium]|nr:DUF992 domain-containing protein [Stellaceae bacterium]
MLRKLGLAIAAAAFLGGGGGLGTAAQAQPAGVAVGTLTCNVAGGWGFIFGSSRALRCVFSHPGFGEHYAGTISKFGVDIGYTQGAVMIWTVFAPTASLRPGSLAGNYIGATGSATVGVGIGANVLVGGSNRTITLQPVSIEGNTGLNVAAGVGAIALRFRR